MQDGIRRQDPLFVQRALNDMVREYRPDETAVDHLILPGGAPHLHVISAAE